MLYVTDQQLRAQNNGHAWSDCNERGHPHRWFSRHVVRDRRYWGCRRCPVDTITALTDVPNRYLLRRGSPRRADRATARSNGRIARP